MAAPFFGLGGIAIAAMSSFSDSPDAALVFGLAGGLASLVTYVRGCTLLIRAGKELEAVKAQQP
jgi:drug/metabolite transporter (DMT)-like permease